MSEGNSTLKAHLALLGANLFYGAGFTIAKTVMPRLIQPLGFILIRVAVVTALFWLTVAAGPAYRTKIDRKDWKILVLGGLFGIALNQMLFFYGLNLTMPIHASLIMMSTPLLITIIAAAVLKAGLSWEKALGLALGIGGASLLMLSGKELKATPTALQGDISILVNAAFYAIYLVIIKPLMARYRPVIVVRWVFLFGLLFVLPFGWGQVAEIDWSRFEGGDFAAVAFIVVCCTFFTYLWNIYALRVLPPSTAGAYIYLQPFFAAIISVLFLNEGIGWAKAAAAALIFSGVYLVNFGAGVFKNGKLPQR